MPGKRRSSRSIRQKSSHHKRGILHSNILTNYGKKWTKGREQLLIRLVDAKESWTEVAVQLGTTKSACENRYRMLKKPTQRQHRHRGIHSKSGSPSKQSPSPRSRKVRSNWSRTLPPIQDSFLDFGEIKALQCGDRIDHRHHSGQYLPARIKAHDVNAQSIVVHYIGYDAHNDIVCDYGDAQKTFARFRSISDRPNTRFPGLQKGDWIQCRIECIDSIDSKLSINNDTDYRYEAAQIMAMDDQRSHHKSGQLFVQSVDGRRRRWVHPDDPVEVECVLSYHTVNASNSNGSFHGSNGNTQIQQYPPFESLFLTEEQIKGLQVHDNIDHKDSAGRFLPARIIAKNVAENILFIHYNGFSTEHDVECAITEKAHTFRRFARYQTISGRPNTRYPEMKVGDIVECKHHIDAQFGRATIISLDDSKVNGRDGTRNTESIPWRRSDECGVYSGQVFVETDHGFKEWFHADDARSIRYDPKQTQRDMKSQCGASNLVQNQCTFGDHGTNAINQMEEQKENRMESQDEVGAPDSSTANMQLSPLQVPSESNSQSSDSNDSMVVHEVTEDPNGSDSNVPTQRTTISLIRAQPLPIDSNPNETSAPESERNINGNRSRGVKRKRFLIENASNDRDHPIEISSDDEEVKVKPERKMAIKRQRINNWNTQQILDWFERVGFGEYVDLLRPHFEEAEMDGKGLRLMNMEDLRSFGVGNFYDSKMILRQIKKLRF